MKVIVCPIEYDKPLTHENIDRVVRMGETMALYDKNESVTIYVMKNVIWWQEIK